MSLRKRLSFKRVWNFNTVSNSHTLGRTGFRPHREKSNPESDRDVLPEVFKEVCV